MSGKASNSTYIVISLLFAIFIWGANNAATKVIVTAWPPVWTGGSRFLCAGLLLLGLLHWTGMFGSEHGLDRPVRMALWFRPGLSLAVYIVVFNTALRFTSVSHVALYLGAAPVWALLWEGRPGLHRDTFRRYGAALLALSGVFVLFYPALKTAKGVSWAGELLGLLASVLWTNYGRQCRAMGDRLSGPEITAHSMWRAGVWLMPWAAVEVVNQGLKWTPMVGALQLFCIVGGGVVAFGIWNHALTRWPASKVLLFNNLIPLSSMSWAHFTLGEPVTPTFWVAMLMVASGVVLGQVKWPAWTEKVPPE